MSQLDPSSSSISTPNPIPSEQPLQVEVNTTPMDGDLFKAAKDGDMELFSKYQGDLHCLVDGMQNTALHIYSRTGVRQFDKTDISSWFFPEERFNFAKQLVDKCPSLLMQPNVEGEIPLHIAARYGHSDMVNFLIERVKRVHHKDVGLRQMLTMTDKERNTALHKAVESGELDVVELLVRLYPDFSFSSNKSRETPIYIASKAGRSNLVVELLDNCKSMDYGGPDGRTALHAAVMAWDEKSVRKLIKANEQLTKKTDNNGWTPLHYAAHYNRRSIAKVLIESDASAAYITEKERGMTALHLAAWGGKKAIMEDIIDRCPDCCEIVDKRGWNFLHFTFLTLDSRNIKRFLLDDKNKIKGLPIKNLADKKDINGNRPFDILIHRNESLGGEFGLYPVFDFLACHGSENYHYIKSSYQSKKKQIQQQLKDMANNEEIMGLRFQIFHKIVKKDQEMEEIAKHEIMEKARESHLVAATLVATVTFSAAFTVPGGYKSDEQAGTATLIHDSAFKTFIITNTLAFVASILAIFFHFILVMLRGDLQKYFKPSFIRRADQLTVFAMAALVAAFGTGTYAVLQSSSGFAIAVLFIGLVFFPSTVAWFTFDYFRSLIQGIDVI